MTQAFYTGLSGIKGSQAAIDVTSNNIANISTIGYRGYTAEFASLFETMLNNTDSKTSVAGGIGLGSALQTMSMDQNSGVLSLSERSTDLAIYGDGWFGIAGKGDTMYTRAGSFTFDENNNLVTPDGYYVLGTRGNNINDTVLTNVLNDVPLGDVNTQEILRFPKTLTYPPEATSNASFHANIGVIDEVRTIGAGVVDPNGVKNNLQLTFTKSAVQTPPGMQWDVVANVKSLDGDTIYDTQSGVANFDATGAIISTTLTTIDNNGATVAIDLGEGYGGVVSINTPVVTGSSISDGTIGGDLMGYSINRNAEVIATFTNGKQSSVGQIAVYHFQNDQGLDRASGANFRESSNSGEPLFFQDKNGNNILGADVLNFQLENSNVRMEVALTELIILQRSFDANSRSITTADDMLQRAIDMGA